MSSSSEDSDDDLLSSAPVFTKKRKEKASEKRAFNYLDSMLKKSEKRTEQQSRIQDLKEKEMVGNEKVNGNNDVGELNDDATVGGLGGGSDDEGNTAFERDGGRGRSPDEGVSKKIKLLSGDVLRVGDAAESPDEGYPKGVKQVQSLSSHNSSSSLSSLPPTTRKKIDIDNVEYWSDLKSRTGNPSLSVIERDRRRQNLRDAIDEDLVTGKSSLLGTRCLFGVHYTDPTKDTNNNCAESSRPGFFSLFENLEECMRELMAIIEMMDKAAPRYLKVSQKRMWNHVRAKIIDPIKRALSVNLLPEMLEKGSIWTRKITLNKKINGDGCLVMPFDLVRWLIRTSLSGKTVGTQLCFGAHKAAWKILESNDMSIMSTCTGIHTESTDEEGTIDYIFHVRDFVSILESEFGLWTGEGCPSLPQCGKEPNIIRDRSFGNEFGLKNALELWTIALDNDFVTCDGDFSNSFSKDSWDCDGVCICSITAKLVATLCRSGLDPSFHAGYRLRQPQGELINSTFDWMERRFHSKQNGPDCLQKWIEHTADISIRSCSNLSSTIIPNGEGRSDNRGWLPLMLAIQTHQIVDQTNEAVMVFFACFVCRAAKLCMEDVDGNWDSKVVKNVTALMKDVAKEGKENFSESRPSNDIRMKCVVNSEIILDSIKRVGDKVTRDGPRFLASVILAVYCELIGMTLFNFNAKTFENPAGIYESKAEAAAMCDHYERLESLSTVVKKQVQSILSDKNMMRVKELLSLMCGFFRHCKSNAIEMSNRRESRVSKQQSMDVYMKGNSPDEQEQ